MLIAVILFVIANIGGAMETAIDLVVPDSWLAILRIALHGTGTPLVQALLYRFDIRVVAAVAITADIVFVLILLRAILAGIKMAAAWWNELKP